jgi:hypothetical protein
VKPSRVHSLAAAALPALLAGCHVEVPDPLYSRCHALATDGWTAQIIRGPVPDRRDKTRQRLLVAGRVTVPTGGFTASIEDGPLQRLAPPAQQVILRMTPPDEGATQAATTLSVSGVVPLRKGVASVSVRCGDGLIARIPSIEPED